MKCITVGLLLSLSMNFAHADVFAKFTNFGDSANIEHTASFGDSENISQPVPNTSNDTTFAPDYRWPVDISRHLSGTFGETRSAHFHSGLDIKTWGREGYPVFASEQGYISRIAISAVGYGKVLYVTHPNGYTSVYAHLQRFRPDIQAYIDSIRVARGFLFEIDVDLGYAENRINGAPTKPRFEVNRGERIAFSGSSGIGPPHLHFEIRNPEERALNALEYGIAVKDQISPTIRSLMVLPLSARSRVQGQTTKQAFRGVTNENGATDFGVIEVDGPIGVAFDIFDRADEVTNKYAFYEAWLIDHGIGHEQGHEQGPEQGPDKGSEPGNPTPTRADTVFYQRIDAVDFEDGGAMFFDRLAGPDNRRRSYQAFFPQEGPSIPFYKQATVGPGVGQSLGSQAGEQRRFELVVKDYNGNTSRAFYRLEQRQSQPPIPDGFHLAQQKAHQSAKNTAQNTFAKHPSDWNWQTNWVSINDSITAELPDSSTHWIQNHQLFSMIRLNPNKPSMLRSQDQRIRLLAEEGSFSDTLSLGVFHDHFERPLLGILPLPLPQQKPITIEWFVGDYLPALDSLGYTRESLALFKFNPEENSFSRVSSQLRGGTLRARVSGSGLFTLWADTLAPKVSNVKVGPTVFGSTGVRLNFSEEHSGINTKASFIRVNGKQGIIEYDYEEDEMLYYLPGWIAQPSEPLLIEYEVVDGSGNRTKSRIEQSVP